MVAENEKGQSLIEFLVMLPMLFGITLIMIRVNTAIQISIANQQASRNHILYITMNSPVYPSIQARLSMADSGANQMMMGVSDVPLPDDSESLNPGEIIPIATEQNVSRKKNAGSNIPQNEPDERGRVRVRNTVSLCTQANAISVDGNVSPILPMGDSLVASAQYNLPEDAASRIEYCRSSLNEQ